MELEDSTLIRMSLSGDTKAIDALVKRYQRALYTFLLRLTGDQDRADDLFQETFLRVLQSLDSYEEREKFGSWLFRIANRVAVDSWRRSRTSRKHITTDTQEIIGAIDGQPLPDMVVEQAELVGKIESTLRILSDKQRRVFLLRMHGDLRFREIAEILEEPLNTVLSHMRYAVARLRKDLLPYYKQDSIFLGKGKPK